MANGQVTHGTKEATDAMLEGAAAQAEIAKAGAFTNIIATISQAIEGASRRPKDMSRTAAQP